jgi:hypothetical protein
MDGITLKGPPHQLHNYTETGQAGRRGRQAGQASTGAGRQGQAGAGRQGQAGGTGRLE